MERIAEHADEGLAEGREVMGLIVGAVYRDAGGEYAVATGLATSELDADGSGVRFSREGIAGLACGLDAAEGRDVVGWYHSHLGCGCALSETDVRTQRGIFGGECAFAVVVDPQRGEISVYGAGPGDPEPAAMVVTERSHPDGVPAAHVLLGHAQLPHEAGHHAVEEDPGGVLEHRPQRGVGRGLVAADVYLQHHVGRVRQLAVRVGGDAHNVRADAPGYVGGLHGGERLAGVGDEDGQVVLPDDRRGHVADEVHVEPQLHEAHRELLPHQPGAAGAVDEDRLPLQHQVDEAVLGLPVDRADRLPDALEQVVQRAGPHPRSSPSAAAPSAPFRLARTAFRIFFARYRS